MLQKSYHLGDVITMKKPHPCGTNEWQIIRMGMDIRIKCINCGRSVLVPRVKFEKALKKVVRSAASSDTPMEQNHL
jgi:hypothetical protein